MSILRNKMILQMQIKGHRKRTIKTYTKCILALAVHYNMSPDILTSEQIRQFIHYRLTEKNICKPWLRQFISALKILFCDVLKREWKHLDIPKSKAGNKTSCCFSKRRDKESD